MLVNLVEDGEETCSFLLMALSYILSLHQSNVMRMKPSKTAKCSH